MNYKIWGRWTLVTVLLLSSVHVKAFEAGDLYYNILSEAPLQCEVTFPETGVYSGNIEVPSIVEFEGVEYTVTGIGHYAFAGSETLANIVLPPTIKAVGRNAFQNCTGLTEMKLPETVSEIGQQTFYGCASLKTFSGMGVEVIGTSAFSGCTNLVNVEVRNEKLTRIGENAFKNCKSLELFVIPGPIELGEGIFTGCNSLRTINLGHELDEIPDYTFNGCLALETIYGVETLVYIGNSAFQACESLASFEFSPSIEMIADNAFAFCTSLKSLNITATDGVIGSSAFAGCTSLSKIAIEGIRDIEEEAFSNCTLLKEVYLGESTKYIRERAFAGSEGITEVWCIANQPPFLKNTSFASSVYLNAVLSVLPGSELLYRQTPPWNNFMRIIDTGIEEVEADEFEIKCIDNKMIISGQRGQLTVFDLSGALLYRSIKEEGEFSLELNFCPGIYIVNLNGHAKKIVR